MNTDKLVQGAGFCKVEGKGGGGKTGVKGPLAKKLFISALIPPNTYQ